MGDKEEKEPVSSAPPSRSPRAGRRGAGDGEAIRQRLQPDHHLAIRGPQSELQEHVQAQAAAGEVAARRR